MTKEKDFIEKENFINMDISLKEKIDEHYSNFCAFVDDVSTKRSVDYSVIEEII